MLEFKEDDMADVIISNTESLLGEPLTLLARKLWIGRYELDLLFQDRHGGKLIVELQRGSLDRYHMYKVLDYYDEYKDRHPEDFVEVMVVANEISSERKARLARRGINFKEIPNETVRQYLSTTGTTVLSKPAESENHMKPASAGEEKIRPEPPEWFRHQTSQLKPHTQDYLLSIAEDLMNLSKTSGRADYSWRMLAALGKYLDSREHTSRQDILRSIEIEHRMFWGIDLDERHFNAALQNVEPELVDFLRLAYH